MMKSLCLRLSALAGMLLLASCGSMVPTGTQIADKGQQALSAKPDCCKSLSEAQALPLPLEKLPIKFDEKLNASTFGGQRSFFVFYKLPAYTKIYSIVVTSQAQGNGTDLSLLVPHVSFYDKDFRLTREFDEKNLRNRGMNFERTVFMNPENAAEQYVLIRSVQLEGFTQRSFSVITSQAVSVGPGMTAFVSNGADMQAKIRSSPVGNLEIDVQGLVEKAVAK